MSYIIDFTTFASISLLTELNNSISWTNGDKKILLSGTITLKRSSKVYINGVAAVTCSNYGARAVISLDGVTAQDTIYTASTTNVTLVAQGVYQLDAGTHTIELAIKPDGLSGAAGSARDYSLVAFEI